MLLLWSSTSPRYAALPLSSSASQVGRSVSCDIAVPDDNLVSRRHSEISFDSGTRELVIRDAASKHGTYVDGERIAGEERVSLAPHEHCVLRVGDSILVAFGDATAHINDARTRKMLLELTDDEPTVIGATMRAVRANVERAARAECRTRARLARHRRDRVVRELGPVNAHVVEHPRHATADV